MGYHRAMPETDLKYWDWCRRWIGMEYRVGAGMGGGLRIDTRVQREQQATESLWCDQFHDEYGCTACVVRN